MRPIFSYDAVVVGAGPGGSTAARTLAGAGVKTLLVEKRQEIGAAVRCGEVVGPRSVMARFIDIDESWVYQDIDELWLFPPGGRRLTAHFPRCGMVVDRKRFDKALAIEAARTGADVWTKARVTGLTRTPEGIRVHIRHLGEDRTVSARVVVGADGVEFLVVRWAGIRTALGLARVFSAVQYPLTGVEGPSHTLRFYFGNTVAPGGYLWIFPKTGGTANVGLCLSPALQKGRRAVDYLDAFVARHFPASSSVEMVMGGIPVGGPLKTLVSDGVVLVGDAGHQVNPLSAGGIVNAMETGVMAGEVIVEALKRNDVSAQRLEAYDRRWNDRAGNLYRLHARLRRMYYKLSDADLDRLGDRLEEQVRGRNPDDLYTFGFAASVVRSMAWMIPKFRFMVGKET
ncbi:MAG: NAD(P)/FAD-dependent oxidoreductase [candidate division Zixibacteria bacterium]|nr:NAD(P)/FAD-dependent oxidoreductase [candidate division Zixibacteria bacterium]